MSDFLPSESPRLSDAQKPGVLYLTLPCGCEEEHVREADMLYLHYLPTCWRHAPSPPFVIEEEP